MTTRATLLAFDTSGPYCMAALVHDGQVATRTDKMAKGQAEHLMPMLQNMLQSQNMDFDDLDGIGVSQYPPPAV